MTSQADDMNPERPSLGFDTCTECGETTCRRLPRQFPHICSACLFPPRGHGDGTGQQMEPLVWTDLLDMLHRTVARHAIDFFKPYGRDPEQQYRGPL